MKKLGRRRNRPEPISAICMLMPLVAMVLWFTPSMLKVKETTENTIHPSSSNKRVGFLFTYVCTVYLCMYASMYVCMQVCMYVCMYVCTYVPMYVCMYVCMYACMHACCMYVCMYVCMHVFPFCPYKPPLFHHEENPSDICMCVCLCVLCTKS